MVSIQNRRLPPQSEIGFPSDKSDFTSRWGWVAAMILRDIPSAQKLAAVFGEGCGARIESSIPGPANQRNSRLYWIYSININGRQAGMGNRIWISRSAAIEGRPNST